MAKGGHRRKDTHDKSGEDTARGQQPQSFLDQAFLAYEAGDMVRARRLAHKAKQNLEAAAEQSAAKQVAKKLMVPEKDRKPFTAEEVVSELLSRTEVPLKPYLFVGVAAAIILLMIVLAIARS